MSTPARQQFASEPTTPAAARRFATATLLVLLGDRLVPDLRADVELVVSELVTNAVRAGAGPVQLDVAVTAGRVVLRVTDAATGWPQQRVPGIHDTGGRGLPLVAAVSAAWGVHMAPTGKVVWAELAIASGY